MIFNPNPPVTDRKVRAFKLSQGFLEQFQGKQPEWGFGGLGYFTYKRTYARTLSDGTTEEFWQTCQRVVEGCFNIQKDHCLTMGLMWNEPKAQKSAQDMFQRLWDFKWTPPGRGLWMMGTDLIYDKGAAALQNCAFVSTKDIDQEFAAPFTFLMDMSMLGVGVGGDTRGEGKARIQTPKTTDTPFLVEDSREGWVELARTVLNSFVGRGQFPLTIDYTKVRPRGTAILGFGGIASGAAPLKRLVEGVTRLLLPEGVTVKFRTVEPNGAQREGWDGNPTDIDEIKVLFEGQGKPYRIQSDQIVDVFNFIGKCVVAGGVRRCLPAGTLVHTAEGLVPIEKVKVGSQVMTSQGLSRVTDWVEQGVQPISQVVTQMGVFEATDKHKIAVISDVSGGYSWKKLHELEPGDRMVFVDRLIEGVATEFPSYNYASPLGSTTCTNITIPKLDAEMAWLLGLFQGDGYVNDKEVSIAVAGDQGDIAARAMSCLQRFGVNVTVQDPRDGDQCFKVRVKSKQLAEFLGQFKQPKTTLEVPDIVLRGLPEVRAAFVAGLMDADGSIKNRPLVVAASVYPSFLEGVQAVLASLGVPSRFQLHKDKSRETNGWQPLFHLTVVGEKALAGFQRKVASHSLKFTETRESSRSQYDYGFPSQMALDGGVSGWKDGQMRWSRSSRQITIARLEDLTGQDVVLVPVEVIYVEHRVREDETYDISVEAGEFVVQGGYLVHNTAEIMFGQASDEKFINLKSNADLLPLYARESELRNLIEKNPGDFQIGQWEEELGEVEQAIQAHPLNDRRWASNNSVFGYPGMDYTSVASRIAANGEPGIFWLDNARQYGRMGDPPDGRDHRILGTNPCGEQSLESFELCVSSDTYIQHRRGIQAISELAGESVDIWNGDGWSTVTPRVTGEGRELFRVHLSDGSYLDCTGNHGWHVKPVGKRVFRRVETAELTKGSQVISFDIDAPIDGEHNVAAFEWGLFAGGGYLDREGGYTYPMVAICGEKAKLMDLDVHGTWHKPQIVEGYTDPVNRLNLKGILPVNVAESLRSKTSGLAPDILRMDRGSILEFMAGWIEADGSITNAGSVAEGFRLYGSEAKLRDAQLLLRRVGVNHASLRMFAEAGAETNYGTRNYDLYYLTIPSYECAEIPTRLKVLTSLGDRYTMNNAHPKGQPLDRAREQKVVKVEKLDGLHTTYCFDEPENHMGVFGNVLTYQCNLVETYPAHHADMDDYKRTLKMAYLYAKTVTLVPTHDPRANLVMQRNRRIGCSMSGIAQARQKLGHREFLNWCDDGYEYIRDLDRIYSEWLGVPLSKKTTSIKPSGTVSLLAGATPGIHFPHSEFYIRRIRLSNTSTLIKAAREAGYTVEADHYADDTSVIEFPVHEKNFDRAKDEVSIWEQFSLAAALQKHWADNQVSVTVTFSSEEVSEIPRCLEAFEDQLKSISMLPLKTHGYVQAPYETINEATYHRMMSGIKPLNFDEGTHDVESEDKFCSGESCQLPWALKK